MITSRGTFRSRSRRLRTARVVASNSSVIARSNFIVSPVLVLKERGAVYPTRPGRLHLLQAAGVLLVLLIAQQQQLITIQGSGRVASAWPDAIHGAWFACVTWIVLSLVGSRYRRSVTLLSTVAIGVAIAVGTELLQAVTGGDAEVGDVCFDMIGMTAAICAWCGHRKLIPRRLGVALAALVVVVGMWTAVDSHLIRFTGPPGVNPHTFFMVPLVAMILYVIYFAGAVYYRKRPAEHKALMLMTAFNFVGAAIARIPLLPPQYGMAQYYGIPDIFALVSLAWFTWKHKKFNWVFASAVALFIISQPLSVVIGYSQPWLNLMSWIASANGCWLKAMLRVVPEACFQSKSAAFSR